MVFSVQVAKVRYLTFHILIPEDLDHNLKSGRIFIQI